MALFGIDLATGLSLLSTGVKFYSAFQGGKDQEDAYDAQAATTLANARRALIESRTVADVAYQEATKIRTSGTEARSAARAGYAAGGVNVDTGTAADVQADINRRANEDALNTILLGERQRSKLIDEAAALGEEATQYSTAGNNAARAGWYTAAGNALSGGADAYAKWQAAHSEP